MTDKITILALLKMFKANKVDVRVSSSKQWRNFLNIVEIHWMLENIKTEHYMLYDLDNQYIMVNHCPEWRKMIEDFHDQNKSGTTVGDPYLH